MLFKCWASVEDDGPTLQQQGHLQRVVIDRLVPILFCHRLH